MSPDRRFTFPVLLLSVLGLAVLTTCSRDAGAPEPGSPPVAVFPQPFHPFGAVIEGERLEHEFEIRNEGGSPLRVDAVETSANLELVSFDEEVPPGGRGTLRVAFDTGGRRGPGRLEARVSTNDPEAPLSHLRLEGRVVERLEITPRPQAYFFAARGAGGSQTLTVVNHGAAPVKVAAAILEHPHFSAELASLEGGRRYRVTVRLDGSAPAGVHQAELVLETDDPERPEIRVPVRAAVE